jgi:hypothetical protein
MGPRHAGAAEPGRERRRAKRKQAADQKDRADSAIVGDEPERRDQQSERHVREGRLDADRETLRLGRGAAHRLNTQARIDERVAEAGKRRPCEAEPCRWRQPDERPSSRLDER